MAATTTTDLKGNCPSGRRREYPGGSGEQAREWVDGVVAVFAAGLDVAAGGGGRPVTTGAQDAPEMFGWSLTVRRPRSARSLPKGIRRSTGERQDFVLVIAGADGDNVVCESNAGSAWARSTR
jgi:hypothetical protein